MLALNLVITQGDARLSRTYGQRGDKCFLSHSKSSTCTEMWRIFYESRPTLIKEQRHQLRPSPPQDGASPIRAFGCRGGVIQSAQPPQYRTAQHNLWLWDGSTTRLRSAHRSVFCTTDSILSRLRVLATVLKPQQTAHLRGLLMFSPSDTPTSLLRFPSNRFAQVVLASFSGFLLSRSRPRPPLISDLEAIGY
jgi:hypothetical protein